MTTAPASSAPATTPFYSPSTQISTAADVPNAYTATAMPTSSSLALQKALELSPPSAPPATTPTLTSTPTTAASTTANARQQPARTKPRRLSASASAAIQAAIQAERNDGLHAVNFPATPFDPATMLPPEHAAQFTGGAPSLARKRYATSVDERHFLTGKFLYASVFTFVGLGSGPVRAADTRVGSCRSPPAQRVPLASICPYPGYIMDY